MPQKKLQPSQFQPPQEKSSVVPPKLNKKELAKEAIRQRQIVKDQIYPILLKHAKNIRNAKNICKTLVIGLDTVYAMDMRKYSEFRSADRLSTLNLKGFMNEGKEYEAEWELVQALKDEKIKDAKGLIDGLEKELQRLTDKAELTTALSELKTEFL